MSLRSYILILLFVFTAYGYDTSASDAQRSSLGAGVVVPVDSLALRLAGLNEELFTIMERGNTSPASGELAATIEAIIAGGKVNDTLILSDSHYLLGYYYLVKNSHNTASANFSLSSTYRGMIGLA
ncbi:MAG: hypothetical protein ABR531_09890, partial [Bacteroidales bacterium]